MAIDYVYRNFVGRNCSNRLKRASLRLISSRAFSLALAVDWDKFVDSFRRKEFFGTKGGGGKIISIILNIIIILIEIHSYRDMARKASFEFRDRPIPPLDEGVYWIEYLLRHGPDSLRTTAPNLTWYQYLLLDVILAIIISIVLTVFIVYKLLKLLIWKGRMSIDVNKKRSWRKILLRNIARSC